MGSRNGAKKINKTMLLVEKRKNIRDAREARILKHLFGLLSAKRQKNESKTKQISNNNNGNKFKTKQNKKEQKSEKYH